MVRELTSDEETGSHGLKSCIRLVSMEGSLEPTFMMTYLSVPPLLTVEKVPMQTKTGASVNVGSYSEAPCPQVNSGLQLTVPKVKYCYPQLMWLPQQPPEGEQSMKRSLLNHICAIILSHLIQAPLWPGFH